MGAKDSKDDNSAKQATIGVPMTYGVKITRGTRGAYGLELEVNNAPTAEVAVREIKRVQSQLLDAMPELRVTNG